MEFRRLGASGFKVTVLCLGAGAFGGSNEFYRSLGAIDRAWATRMVGLCLHVG